MRLQAATEFLVTYGWAFLIIAVILLVLLANGLFNPLSYAAESCSISSGFTCIDYAMSIHGRLLINLRQTTGEPINITSLECTQTGGIPNFSSELYPSSQVYMPIGSNFTFFQQCYSSTGKVNSLVPFVFSGTIQINYTDDITRLPATASGTLIVKALG